MLTPAVQTQIVADVRAGAYAQVAAQRAGICVSTYFGWLRRGEAAKDLDPVPASERPYVQFLAAIEDAEAHAEVEAVRQLQKHAKRNPKATIEFLARRFQARWNPAKKLEHTVPPAAGLDLSVYTDDELAELERIHERAAARAAKAPAELPPATTEVGT